jgi:hypothetical protein
MKTDGKPVVFISGKMLGVPYYNFPAINEARDRLESLGFATVAPLSIIHRDSAAVDPADAVFVLREGADTCEWTAAEVMRAIRLGKLVLTDAMSVREILAATTELERGKEREAAHVAAEETE